MKETVSIAIETSCRLGGVALGVGERLVAHIDFDAASRHATQLVVRLRELLAGQGLRATDVNEVYVSAGPGSFTGIRVGITVARTLAGAVGGLRCVSVPTTVVVAQNAAALEWQHLAVILDAKEDLVYSQLFSRNAEVREGVREGAREIVPAGEPSVMPLADFLSSAPKPLLLTGEGLLYQKGNPPDSPTLEIALAAPSVYYPTAQSAWTVGRRLARAEQFTEYHHLLPIYARRSEAERLWELKHGTQ